MKNFLTIHAKDYQVEVIYSGGDPRLILLDIQEIQLEEIVLISMDENQIMQLLEEKGFGRKTREKDSL